MEFAVLSKKTYDRKEAIVLPYHIEFKASLDKFNAKDASYIEAYVRDTNFSRNDIVLLRLPEMNCFALIAGIRDDLLEGFARAIRKYRNRVETVIFDIDMLKGFSLNDEMLASLIADSCLLGSYARMRMENLLDETLLKHVVVNVAEDRVANFREHMDRAVQNASATRDARAYGNLVPSENQVDLLVDEFKRALSKKWKVKVSRLKELKTSRYSGLSSLAQFTEEEPAMIVAEFHPERGKSIVLAASIVLPHNIPEQRFHARMLAGSVLRSIAHSFSQYDRDASLIIVLSIAVMNESLFRQGPVRLGSGNIYEVSSPDHATLLALADAIYHGSKYKPRQIISFTSDLGGFSSHFGKRIIGYVSNTEPLAKKMDAASKRTRESSWRLPLIFLEEVSGQERKTFNLKGAHPDASFMNTRFLEVNASGYPWMHLDLSAHNYAWKDEGLDSRGSTGFGASLVVEYLRATK